MARRKSVNDLQAQFSRVGKALAQRMSSPRSPEEYDNLAQRHSRVSAIAHAYSDNIKANLKAKSNADVDRNRKLTRRMYQGLIGG